MPDISYILFNGSVRGELAGTCCIENGHSVPCLAVSVSFIDLRTCLGIRSEVFQNEVNILVDQRIEQPHCCGVAVIEFLQTFAVHIGGNDIRGFKGIGGVQKDNLFVAHREHRTHAQNQEDNDGGSDSRQ